MTPRRLPKRKTIQTIVNTEGEHHSFAGGWNRFRAAFESKEIQKIIEFSLVLALNLSPLNPQLNYDALPGLVNQYYSRSNNSIQESTQNQNCIIKPMVI